MKKLFWKQNGCLLLLVCLIQINQVELKAKTIKDYAFRRYTSVAESVNEFAFALQRTFPSRGNIIYSPWAIASALAMIAMGANGNTLQQMREAMFLTQIAPDNVYYNFHQLAEHLIQNSNEYDMNMFSTILVQERYNISAVYKIKLRRYFDSDIHEVNFSELGTLVTEWINVWTALKTGGKIKSILTSPPDQDTVMLLLIANYFKGVWDESFNPNETTAAEFHNDDGSVVEVDMMHSTRNLTIFNGDQFALDAVDVPMKGDISFLFIMPKRMGDMEILQRNLSNSFLSEIYKEMSLEPVNLGVPKFEASSRIELEESLQNLGMMDLFSVNDADLSGINSNRGLSIQDVIHKASLEINEQGAVATSVTVISIVSRIQAYKLHFNRPFIFIIRDVKSGTILFMGRISKL